MYHGSFFYTGITLNYITDALIIGRSAIHAITDIYYTDISSEVS
jgi:hypothetical protein